MKTKTFFLLICFIAAMPSLTNAQLGGMVKNRLNKAINAGAKTAGEEMRKEADTAVQKEVEAKREKQAAEAEQNRAESGQPSAAPSSEGSAEQSSAPLGKLFGNKIDLKYKEDYSFTSRIYMITESYDKDEVIKMDFFMFYSSSHPSVAVETKTIANQQGEVAPVAATMVMDGENKCFLALTDMNGMKMGVISAIPDENAAQDNSKKDKKDAVPTFTKTGKSKVIAGYKCDEYSYTAEDKTSGKVWFTKDAKLKIDKNGWNNTGMSRYYGNPEFNEGIILANEAYDSKGKLTMKAETQEINENFPHDVSVKGYTLRQMNMGQGNKK